MVMLEKDYYPSSRQIALDGVSKELVCGHKKRRDQQKRTCVLMRRLFTVEIGTFMKFLQGNGYIYDVFARKWVYL